MAILGHSRVEVDALVVLPGGHLPQIILYEHDNYQGWSLGIFEAVNLNGDANDHASSARVVSGTWRLWRNHNLHEDGDEGYVDLPPGNYPSLEEAGRVFGNKRRAGWNDKVSSLQPIAP